MPVHTVERMSCNVCGLESERELFSNLPPPKGWITFKAQNGADKRERIKVAICPDCGARISELNAANQQKETAPLNPTTPP